MLLANELLSLHLAHPFRRRWAAGIDVNADEVRLVVLSRRARRTAPVGVEWLSAVPLPRKAMAGVQIAERDAVSRAIAELFAAWPRRRATGPLSCAMALPGSATLIDTIDLPFPLPCAGGAHLSAQEALDAMEPAVYAHAERIAGLERQALAADWFVDEASLSCGPASGSGGSQAGGAPRVTIAAAERQHLEARVEAAAAAGIVLYDVDGEPPAALRALCYAAAHELQDTGRFAAVWIGGEGVYGWRIADDAIEACVRYPAPEHADLAAALRALGDAEALNCVVAGGDLDLLADGGMTLADAGDLIGCAMLPFECAPFINESARDVLARTAQEWLHSPTFAVAFGLALRGVRE
jgi:Tfp pilus assembly PilM family ATPase